MFDKLNKINFIQKPLGSDIYSDYYDEGQSPVPPPGTDAILKDDGGFLLTDSGNNLLQG